MTISGVQWSTLTAEELAFSSEGVLAFSPFCNDESVANELWLIDAVDSNWQQFVVLVIFTLLWLCKEPIYEKLYPHIVSLWHSSLYPFFLSCIHVSWNAAEYLESALISCQLAGLFLISLPGLLKTAIHDFVVSTFLTSIDTLTDSLTNTRYSFIEPPTPHVCPEVAPIVEHHHFGPRYVRCSCPPPPITLAALQQQAGELDDTLDQLSDKRHVIRILRGEITALTNQRDELLQYRTRFHDEQAGRHNDTTNFEATLGQLNQQLRDAEAALQAARAELQLAILLNEPAPELGGDLPTITEEMDKIDIINTHYDSIANLRQSLTDEHAAAMNDLETRHGTAIAALEARVATLTAENADYKANSARSLIDNDRFPAADQPSTIIALRQRLEAVTEEKRRAQARAGRLAERIEREAQNAGTHKCCHIADWKGGRDAARVLMDERDNWEKMENRYEERLRAQNDRMVYLAAVAGRSLEQTLDTATNWARMIDIIRDSEVEDPDQVEYMFKNFPKMRRMLEDAGINDWGELERLFHWHGQMKQAVKARKDSSS